MREILKDLVRKTYNKHGTVDVKKIKKVIEEKFKNITHFSFADFKGKEIEFGSKGIERGRLFSDLAQAIAKEIEG